MNKYQKNLLIRFIAVITVTIIAVIAMMNFKDWINYSEAMRAMEHLGQEILQHRKDTGSIPSESYVNRIRPTLKGHLRLGNLRYRATWIDFDSPGDEILAYSESNYHSIIIGHGFIVLRLDGTVEWMDKKQFHKLLLKQQSPLEIEMTKE